MELRKVKAWCKRCRQYTNQEVLFSSTWTPEDEYYVYQEQYAIVRCCGCENLSFKLTIYDESNEDYDEYGELTIIPVETIYPTDRLLVDFVDTRYIPLSVRDIYIETINCINRKDFILGASGCRAVIEAICKEHKVAGKNLNTMISNMVKSRLITDKDRDNLHAIRFMGNDSIHVSCKYTQNDLKIVANIINSILTSLYIITEEARQLKDYPINNFDDFLKILNEIIDEATLGEEKTLKQLTSKKRVILEDYLQQFEPSLIAKISNGEFTRLSLIADTKPQKYKIIDSNQTHPLT